MSDAIAVMEAAYQLVDDDQVWLSSLADTARAQLDQGAGLIAALYDATAPDWIEMKTFAASGLDLALVGPLFQVGTITPAEGKSVVRTFRQQLLGSLRESMAGKSTITQYYEPVLASTGLHDVLFVNATDPSRTGCVLVVPTPAQARWSPRVARRWRRIAAHVAAGLRIRRQLRQGLASVSQAEAASAEAVLSPAGAVEHALDAAKAPETRDALRRAALAFDRARGPLRRESPDESVEIWQGLVDGRWTLLDYFDTDGQRFIVAHRNDPKLPDVRGLTARECQVLAYALLGRSNKDIAYALGIATATVGVHLGRARRKLGGEALSTLGPALAIADEP